MLDNLRSTFKNSIIYGLGTLSTKVVGFVLIPVYIKYLTTFEYGITAIVDISIQILISIFGFGLYYGLFRWYWDKEIEGRQNSLFYTTFVFLSFVAVLLVLIIYPWADKFSLFLIGKPEYGYLIRMMTISAGFQIVIQIPSSMLRLKEKAFLFSIANIVMLIVNLSLTIFFIVYLGHKQEGIYEAQILGSVVYLIFLSKFIYLNIELKLEKTLLKKLLAFSFPIAIASLSSIMLSITDRYAIRFIVGMSETGIYALGYKIANIINTFFIASANLAIGPIVYKMMNDPNNKRFYSKIMTYYAYIVMVLVLIFSFYGKEIIKTISIKTDYWVAYKVIPIICFAFFFQAIKDIALIGLNISKKTKIISIVITSISVFNIIFNVIFIYFFSSIGAAISLLVSQVLYFFLIYYFAQKFYYIPYEFSKIIKILATGILLIGFVMAFNNFSLNIRMLVKVCGLLVFPVILYFLKFYEDIELLRLRQAIEKWKNPKKWKSNLYKVFHKQPHSLS